MKKFINKFKLSYEAYLLDSYLYILKSMVAILFGAIIGNMFSLTKLDMISVLLGVMYNLEATNRISIKGGLNQLLTSALGALSTGTLVYFFGVNPFVIAAGMGITLFISLKINYRLVSPVAIFTSIYMTQYLQTDLNGVSSVFLTFKLRMAALGLGILIALIFNFIFSLLYYKKMIQKRLEFTKLKSIEALLEVQNHLKNSPIKKVKYDMFFANIFTDIETISYQIDSLIKDPLYGNTKKGKDDLYNSLKIIKTMKALVHYSYDIVYSLSIKDNEALNLSSKLLMYYIECLEDITEKLKSINYLKIQNTNLNNKEDIIFQDESRIGENISLLQKEILNLVTQSNKLINF